MKDANPGHIRIVGARLHNLRNVTLDVPKNRLVVLTGLSGSGKSSLAFDTLHHEGQRQYLESLGMVTGFVSRPAVDAITGLSPSISVDQHLTNRSPRSTVGTVTEVFTYLRLLWARLGHRPCPACGGDVPPAHVGAEAADDPDGDADAPPVPCPHCGTHLPGLVMGSFSFNKPAGACPACTGLGVVIRPDPDRLVDAARSVAGGAVLGWPPALAAHQLGVLHAAARHYGFAFDGDRPVADLDEPARDLLLHGVDSPRFRRHFPGAAAPATVGRGRFEGVATAVLRRYQARITDTAYREKTERLLVNRTCPDCLGTRLRPRSRAVTVAGLGITDAARLPLDRLAGWITGLRDDAGLAAPIRDDLRERIRRLVDVGVGYLTLDQAATSLSAGETQRLRLAALLGSGLTGVLYVLDEPTIGLHPADTAHLVGVLRRLRDLGNTVLVVEHDLDVLRAADHLVDIGPGAGRHGGRVVATGSPDDVAATAGSVTGDYLAGRRRVPVPPARRAGPGGALTIRGARAHNLRDLTVRLPLGRLVAVTGPSGSGKSSLMLDILDRAARRHFTGAADLPGDHDGIDGLAALDKVITIDQQPVSRMPRSNAATYAEAYTPIRETFAATAAARERGLGAGHFSFNVAGGRCERCEGAGVLDVSMHFLPAVPVRCPACHGRRFTRDVLAVTYRGHSIADVLAMTVDEAVTVFADVAAAAVRLRTLADVGLGYLPLGQRATTLSGGEAQRVKLARELARRGTGRTLYLLDEPTTGLHPDDTGRLLAVLHRLVDAGNTVVTVEHDLDVVRAADWVIDLGPAGGAAGGRLVAEGTPEQVAATAGSRTGAALAAGAAVVSGR
ncbi:excinuclease ABC subunit UvrA [Jidongwangia harbinensis]|uniref:excinuclease ABC subunit UvrA n=1 Tax=Jidongwangia harbinensis TaxID=2878561 RepID=UPI001CD98356|nr:excinuclease ABC subunit UvrA [Jidongwangia harbinensis]MCA2214971.1 excinuclease ABC subunit UvrA [Jidongwangia harbinensis]